VHALTLREERELGERLGRAGGLAAGVAQSSGTAGVLLLWVTVMTGWALLALLSMCAYRTVPHPDADKRDPAHPDLARA
jgi:hypothetical protein